MENRQLRKVLIPSYLSQFKCTGPECEDTCCAGFSYVDIDKETYIKYKKIKDQPLKNLIKQYVTSNSNKKQNEINYAKICIPASGTCPFLNSERLCKIQLEKGEDYLSNLCGSFPRVSNLFDGKLEKSAVMSCPEAARLALLNPNGIQFVETDETAPFQNVFKAIIDTSAPYYGNKLKYLKVLRSVSIDILKDRRFQVWERLVLLGHFIKKTEVLINDGKSEKMNDLISEFSTYKNQTTEIKKDLSEIGTSVELQFVILTHIIGKKLLLGFENVRYLECFQDFLLGLEYEASKDLDKWINNYENAFQHYYLPFITEKEYILENYLVNYVFRNAFPALTMKTIFDEYLILVIHYSLIKMHLIGMSGCHKKLTEELVVKLIQSLSKTFEHDHQYIEEMYEFLKIKGINTLGHMAILLKN